MSASRLKLVFVTLGGLAMLGVVFATLVKAGNQPPPRSTKPSRDASVVAVVEPLPALTIDASIPDIAIDASYATPLERIKAQGLLNQEADLLDERLSPEGWTESPSADPSRERLFETPTKRARFAFQVADGRVKGVKADFDQGMTGSEAIGWGTVLVGYEDIPLHMEGPAEAVSAPEGSFLTTRGRQVYYRYTQEGGAPKTLEISTEPLPDQQDTRLRTRDRFNQQLLDGGVP